MTLLLSHCICTLSEDFCTLSKLNRLFILTLSDQWSVLSDLITPLLVCLLCSFDLSSLLALHFLCPLSLEDLCLVFDNIGMLLLLHLSLHLGLLLAQLLLLLNLFYDAHFVSVLVSQLFEVCMHFRLPSIHLCSFKVGFQFLTLLFDVLLDHLNCAITEFFFLTVPVADQGLLLLLQPALVVKEPVQIVQVLSVDRGVHAELKLQSISVLLPGCGALPLILIVDVEETLYLLSRKLDLNLLRCQQYAVGVWLLLESKALDLCLVQLFHCRKSPFVVILDCLIFSLAKKLSVDF